jgi:hypothetical protein
LRDAIRRTTSAPPGKLPGRAWPKKAASTAQSVQQCSVCSALPVDSEQHDCSFARWAGQSNASVVRLIT